MPFSEQILHSLAMPNSLLSALTASPQPLLPNYCQWGGSWWTSGYERGIGG